MKIYRWHIQSRHFKRCRWCFAICSSQERWAHFIMHDAARFLDPPGFTLPSSTTSQFSFKSIAKDSVGSLLIGDKGLRLHASAGFGVVRNAPISMSWQTFEAGPDCKCLLQHSAWPRNASTSANSKSQIGFTASSHRSPFHRTLPENHSLLFASRTRIQQQISKSSRDH